MTTPQKGDENHEIQDGANMLELALGTPDDLRFTPKTRVKFGSPVNSSNEKKADGSVIPVGDNHLLMSPELAFKADHSNRKKKKKTFDRFRRSISTNIVVPGYDENIANQLAPQSPVENRKVKTKSSPNKSSHKNKEIRSKRLSIYRSVYFYLFTAFVYAKQASWILIFKQITTILPYVYLGIFVAFLAEVIPNCPKYNLPVLLITLAALNYDKFPERSIRPFIVIFLLVVLSCVMDIALLLVKPSSEASVELKAMVSYIMFAKAIAVYKFINTDKGTERARKFIVRRFHLALHCY